MQAASIQPGKDPMRQQDNVEEPQSQRRWSAARPHALLQKPAIEHRKSDDEDHGKDRQVHPECCNSEVAGRGEQGDPGASQERNGAKIR
jgi:hypothetical protein